MAYNEKAPFGIREWTNICGLPIRTGQIARNVFWPFSSLTKNKTAMLKSAFIFGSTAFSAGCTYNTGLSFWPRVGISTCVFAISHAFVTGPKLYARYNRIQELKTAETNPNNAPDLAQR